MESNQFRSIISAERDLLATPAYSPVSRAGDMLFCNQHGVHGMNQVCLAIDDDLKLIAFVITPTVYLPADGLSIRQMLIEMFFGVVSRS